MKHQEQTNHTPSSMFGEMIVALLEETQRAVPDKKEAYKVVAYIVSDCLMNARANSGSWH